MIISPRVACMLAYFLAFFLAAVMVANVVYGATHARAAVIDPCALVATHEQQECR